MLLMAVIVWWRTTRALQDVNPRYMRITCTFAGMCAKSICRRFLNQRKCVGSVVTKATLANAASRSSQMTIIRLLNVVFRVVVRSKGRQPDSHGSEEDIPARGQHLR